MKTLKSCGGVLLLSAVLLTSLCTFSAQAQIPRGVFSMDQSGGTANDLVLANPDVTGITVRQDWADLEPNEGEFNFEYLDSEVGRAAAAGKQVLLRIGTQAGKPAWVTNAVQEAGGTFFTFDDNGVTTTIPVFWDPTYLAKKKDMITALGAHFASNPTVTIVSASFANATSEDWNVPHTSTDITNWGLVGYTTQKLLDAGQQIIDTTMTAFPTQYVSLAIAGDGSLDQAVTYAPAMAIATADASWPGRLLAQIDSLSACNPVAPGPDDSAWNLLWNTQPNAAAQMVDNVYGDDTTYRVNCGVAGDYSDILTACVNAAASYGVNYIEIYETDVKHLTDVITYAHNLLDPTPAQLGNISTRLSVGVGNNVLIGGFIITGSQPKKVIARAIGPSLSVSGTLSDPILELHDSTGASIATNDNWQDSPNKQEIIDSTIPPTNDKESAILMTLDPGAYTAIVRGANSGTGVALVEVYDLDQSVDSKLANISTRGFVQTGDNVMIGGLIILGTEAAEMIVRAIGPSLPIAGALADPTLDLHDQNGAVIASNDNWRSDQEAEIIATTIPPTNDAESAIVATLAPGPYTAIVSGKNNTTGIALVEAYQLDQ